MSQGYTLFIVNNAPDFNADVRQHFIDTFFAVYPQLFNRFNPEAGSKTVTFTIDPNYSGIAETLGSNVRYNPAYFNSNTEDFDAITHELMHVAQASFITNAPSWLIEGMADYVRYKYGLSNKGWSLTNYAAGQSYTDAYRITARFLFWLEIHVRATIVNDLNTAMKQKTYSANTWSSLTGKSVDQLWSDYANNPVLGRS